jgi:transaldolase
MAKTPLQELADHGQSVWIDYLSRPFVQDGELAGLVDQGVVGVTSNPTIFQGAIAEGDAYDDQIRELVAGGEKEPKEIFIALAADDIRDACDVLRPVYDEGDGKDGYVSLEVDPNLAHDTQGTADEAKRLHAMIEKPNLFIKIPATKEGLPAIEDTIAAGIPVNVTLIFSLERHREVAEAYVRGLQRLADDGGDLSRVASVASFFVSRVDTEADKRLDDAGKPELKGKLAIANAKLAYQTYKEIFSGEAWEALEAKGASKQRCLWASTSTKNPEYRDVIYVEELVGPDTVNTMPRATVEAVLDHGQIRGNTIEEDVDGARKLLDDLAEAGIDYDDVVETLEKEGVKKFADSFKELFADIESKRDQLVAA